MVAIVSAFRYCEGMTKRIEAEGTDITEGVQILYDIAHSSMDWGSGFLDNEEVEAVVRLAVFMGWQVPSLPDNSAPMVSVAGKFPEVYEVTFRHFPATKYGAAYDRPSIQVKAARITTGSSAS
jgi:hypothetical protein